MNGAGAAEGTNQFSPDGRGGVRRVLLVNNRRRELLYLIYFIFIFIAVRIWIIAVDSKDPIFLSACASVTAFLLLAIYYRHIRSNRMRERHMELLQIINNTIIRETNELNESERPQITPDMIDNTLKTFPYNSSTRSLMEATTESTTESSVTRNPLIAETGMTDDSSWDLCVICLNNYSEDELLVQLPCSHVYHKACITEWLLSTNGTPGSTRPRRVPLPSCPLCKCTIEFNSTSENTGESAIASTSTSQSASASGSPDGLFVVERDGGPSVMESPPTTASDHIV